MSEAERRAHRAQQRARWSKANPERVAASRSRYDARCREALKYLRTNLPDVLVKETAT